MLRVENLSFGYDSNLILDNLSFEVKKGEHLSVIGVSGSGKSTLLNLLYGEYDLNEGHIFWNDIEILGPKFNLVVGYDFIKSLSQEFDLMPFITVEENVGQHLSNFFPEEKKERIRELLEIVELTQFSKTKVKLLSGGQKQRVALARALAKAPEIILLDEPFSHIDNFKKHTLRRRVFNYFKKHEITCVVATHDKEDVLGYADKIVVLNDTKIIAIGSPKSLYNDPKHTIIASFFDEFNVIEPYGIVYANQLKKTPKSDLKVIVKQSFFKGDYYLIEAELKERPIFFEHHSELTKNAIINLDVVKD